MSLCFLQQKDVNFIVLRTYMLKISINQNWLPLEAYHVDDEARDVSSLVLSCSTSILYDLMSSKKAVRLYSAQQQKHQQREHTTNYTPQHNIRNCFNE